LRPVAKNKKHRTVLCQAFQTVHEQTSTVVLAAAAKPSAVVPFGRRKRQKAVFATMRHQ
jgi:hypothetical protein